MNQDFFPTVMNLLGVECEVDDGFDMWPLATGAAGAEPMRDYVSTGCQHFVCIRDDRFAVHFDTAKPRGDSAIRALYDLQSDPDEVENVADKHPDVAKEFLDRLEALVGPLPFDYSEKEYQARYWGLDRFNARIMNTYAPMRFGETKK